MNKKAIGLLSGGLDSTLAVKIIQEQGIEVIALNFMSPFCACTAKNAGCKSEAMKVSQAFGLKIKYLYHGQEYLEMLKKPKHGYGRALNPCIDCRIMMFRKAKEYMEEIGASFVFTGEVIGQRPMSQRRDSMNLIERESGLEGYLLRPLCAKLLPETIPEKEGIVDRQKLLQINGRSRKDQIRLAGERHIEDYPCSSGGCLLTEKGFAGKVKDLLDHSETPRVEDARLLRLGRHFRVSGDCRVVIGKNEAENAQLEKMAEPEDFLFTVAEFKGPLGLARGKLNDTLAALISRMVVRYSSAPPQALVPVQYRKAGEPAGKLLRVEALDETKVEDLRIKDLK